jgi:hypothetical protein
MKDIKKSGASKTPAKGKGKKIPAGKRGSKSGSKSGLSTGSGEQGNEQGGEQG